MALPSASRRAVGRLGGIQMVEWSHYCRPYVSRPRSMLLPSPAIAPSSSSVLLKDVHHDEACILLSGTSTSETGYGSEVGGCLQLLDLINSYFDSTEPEPSVSERSYGVQHSLVAARDSPKLSHWFESHGENKFLDVRSHGRRFLDSRTQLLAFAVMCSSLPALVIRNGEQKGCKRWPQVRGICSSNWNSSPRKMERYSGRSEDRDNSGRQAERQARFDENFKRLPTVRKLTRGEYKQSVVDKSTKNMALVPKKWKRVLPNKEVLDAVMYLKRAKGNIDAVKEVVRKRIARLLKLEMMLVLSELQRLDEWFLASQVFNAIRKEIWYKPNVYLYQTMVQTFGKSKQSKDCLRMFAELQAEGLQPDESIKRELLRAYVICGMMSEAIQLYKEIQKSGLLDRAARSILFHGLNEGQKLELAAYEKTQGYDWS